MQESQIPAQSYDPKAIETQMQQHWEQHNLFKVVEDASKEKILLSVDVPLPKWPFTYGPCPQLHHW